MSAAKAYPQIYLYRRIVQAKLFIDAHYANRIDLDNIAGEAAFSKFHFIRLFNSVYNKTPRQYLISVRVRKAELLLSSGKSVAEVCYSVGFESVSTFSGLFKKWNGQSPAAYQSARLKRQGEIKQAPLKFIPNCFAEKNGWRENRNFEEVS